MASTTVLVDFFFAPGGGLVNDALLEYLPWGKVISKHLHVWIKSVSAVNFKLVESQHYLFQKGKILWENQV